MNSKFKIALLTLLGFSASACCGTKRVAKGEDKSEPNIMIQEENDPRVHLMYGVPFPDGSVVRPVDEDGKPIPPPRNGAKSKGAKLPDGNVAYPVDDEVKERVETTSKEAVHDEVDDVDMILE